MSMTQRMTKDRQLLLLPDDYKENDDKEPHYDTAACQCPEESPEASFDFQKLFSSPIQEEYRCSCNAMAVLGDSLSVLKNMRDKAVQLIFADAPYNIGKDFGNNSDKWPDRQEYIEWCKKWIDECMRVLSDTGTMYFMSKLGQQNTYKYSVGLSYPIPTYPQVGISM